MSVNIKDFVHPEAPCKTSFTDAEWQRAKKAIERIRKKLAASCKHLVKAEGPTKPLSRRTIPTKEQYEETNKKLREAERIAEGFED